MRIVITLLCVIIASAWAGYILREKYNGIAQFFFALSIVTAVLFIAAFFGLI
ncbi:MAG: hypothetical protein ACI8W7_002875 [Gammaproteobacteria bacterium]|jgi:hypothetical protein